MLYDLINLHPLSVTIDTDGDTHAVYEFPQPVRWQFRCYDTQRNTVQSELHLVKKMRVCVFISAYPVCRPATVIVPFNEDGQESVAGSIVVQGFSSPVAAFRYLGFTVQLPAN